MGKCAKCKSYVSIYEKTGVCYACSDIFALANDWSIGGAILCAIIFGFIFILPLSIIVFGWR